MTLFWSKPMLYSTYNIDFGENQYCIAQYNINFDRTDVVFAIFFIFC